MSFNLLTEHRHELIEYADHYICGFEYRYIDKDDNKEKIVCGSSIINFIDYQIFNICDADGDKLKGMKHAINAAKKFIDDCIRLGYLK